MTVVFAGGGTGGHLYPAIAIADALRDRARIAFVGTADRLEASIVPRAGYELHTIASRPLPRRPSPKLLHTIAANAKGTVQSLRLLAAKRPDIVIATGGYVAFPVALAARIRRMLHLSAAPLVLLEPNAEPGLTNRMLAPIVDEVWGASQAPARRLAGKYRVTGVPVRATLRTLPERGIAMARLGLDPARKTLVVMGGSQGARSINDAVVRLVDASTVPDGWQIFALTGRDEFQRVGARLPHARAYLDDMADAYAAADLLLTRAGASTLGELAALGKPAILVPYPHAAEGHQATNAARFEAAGAAVVLTDERLREGDLAAVLSQTVDERRLASLASAAARLRGSDPLLAILARVDALLSRKGTQ